MVTRLQALLRSFRYAFTGIGYALRSERNLQIHACATVTAVGLGTFFRISAGEWCAVLLATGLVWSAEILNTAVERLGDAISREPNEDIRHAKDAAAGAVLVAAMVAAGVGVLVFGPRLWVSLFGHATAP